jgi:adenine-specific DNA-methyltransferase
MYNIERLGQVFTPQEIVGYMLKLRKNKGSILEPSCGDGAFFNNIPNCVGIEIDSEICPESAMNIDFFDYSIENKYDTIIGNPPYVRFQDIMKSTKKKLNLKLFDERSNLYLFFIEKSLKHLNDRGEIIFITPRDFLKATSAMKLNNLLYQNGTITDIIELGDQKVFQGYSPNTIIWRYEKDNFSINTNFIKQF